MANSSFEQIKLSRTALAKGLEITFHLTDRVMDFFLSLGKRQFQCSTTKTLSRPVSLFGFCAGAKLLPQDTWVRRIDRLSACARRRYLSVRERRRSIDRRNQQARYWAAKSESSGMPTRLSDAEGNMTQDANRKPCVDPARSETLRMSGSFLHRSWEISSAPLSQGVGGAGKATSRNLAIHADEKSNTPTRAEKPTNRGRSLLRRGRAKGC